MVAFRLGLRGLVQLAGKLEPAHTGRSGTINVGYSAEINEIQQIHATQGGSSHSYPKGLYLRKTYQREEGYKRPRSRDWFDSFQNLKHVL